MMESSYLHVPALIAHGGAGGRGPAVDRPERRRAMLSAVRHGAELLRGGASAIDAVVATVRELENHPLFNAGYGSVLTADGTVEMDAAIVAASARGAPRGRQVDLRAGAVAAVSRVRNPIELARAVMERTPHLLMAGAGAEVIARQAGIELCAPAALISPRSRERWRAMLEGRIEVAAPALGGRGHFGTVGAVALDAHGMLAAATSTGGISGKLPGRVGDSAIIGAGAFAGWPGAASATGQGEAILKVALCRAAVMALEGAVTPARAATGAIRNLAATTGGQAGVIIVDRRGRIGFAHNAEAMDVAIFEAARGFRYQWTAPSSTARAKAPARSSTRGA